MDRAGTVFSVRNGMRTECTDAAVIFDVPTTRETSVESFTIDTAILMADLRERFSLPASRTPRDDQESHSADLEITYSGVVRESLDRKALDMTIGSRSLAIKCDKDTSVYIALSVLKTSNIAYHFKSQNDFNIIAGALESAKADPKAGSWISDANHRIVSNPHLPDHTFAIQLGTLAPIASVTGRPHSDDLAKPQTPVTYTTVVQEFEPWPPEGYSSQKQLSIDLLGNAKNLGDAFKQVRAAFIRAEVPNRYFYTVGQDGFAVISQIECIDSNGSTVKDRWCVDGPTTLSEFIDALVGWKRVEARIIVLVVTPRDIGAKAPVGAVELHTLKQNPGRDMIPEGMASAPLAKSTKLYALVYLFRKTQGVIFEPDPADSLSPLAHLAKAGYWSLKQLEQSR